MGLVYIEDKEFDLFDSKEEDLLGTAPYAETLFEVIKESKGKQNIGLFGGWGSGKSTIIKTLENFILKYNKNNDSQKISFFKYDSWKYSNDEFRRSFIKSLNSEFQIIDDKNVNELLYQETTSENTDKTQSVIDYNRVAALLISAVVLTIVVSKYALPHIGEDFKSILMVISLLASFLFYMSRDAFRVIPFTIKESKLVEAERFEDAFKLITDGIFGINDSILKRFKKITKGYSNYKKLVIVIDNLDRCDHENLKVTLSSLKNFLENENVIFILPVDENGVISFLNQKTENAEEYLRKIFHQIIRLKKFTPKELIDFTKSLNEKYNLNLTKNGIRLVCQEFTTNPRKIIQFLNNLQTERDLIKRQIGKGYVDLDFNQDADDFLIKLLIIKQEWGNLYQNILDDSNFLQKVNREIVRKLDSKNDLFPINIDYDTIKLTRDQKRFFKRNIGIHQNNVESFILNIDRDKDVPDDLRFHIENGEIHGALKVLGIDDQNELNSENAQLFLNQIDSVFDDYSNKFEDYRSIAFPVLELLIDIYQYDVFKEEIKSHLHNYTFINRILSNMEFDGVIKDLNEDYFERYCLLTKWFLVNIEYKLAFKRLTDFLELNSRNGFQNESIINKVNIFISSFRNEPALLKNIKDSFSSGLQGDFDKLNKFEILETDHNISQHLLNNRFFSKGIEVLKNEEIRGSDKWETKFLNIAKTLILNKILKNKTIITGIANRFLLQLKLKQKIIISQTKEIFDLGSTFETIASLLPLANDKSIEADEELFQSIKLSLDVHFDSNLEEAEIRCYKSFLDMILAYMHLNVDFSTDDNLEDYFGYYFTQEKFKELSNYVNTEIYRKEISFFAPYSWPFFDVLVNRFNNKKHISYIVTLMMMYEKTTDKKGLTKSQKEVIIKLVLDAFLYHYYSKKSCVLIKEWLETIYRIDFESIKSHVNNLETNKVG